MKLYDMVLQFLRTLFLRTRNVHYCTLRAELLMSLHELDVGDICSVDPCHKVAPARPAPFPPAPPPPAPPLPSGSSPSGLWPPTHTAPTRPRAVCQPPHPLCRPGLGAPESEPPAPRLPYSPAVYSPAIVFSGLSWATVPPLLQSPQGPLVCSRDGAFYAAVVSRVDAVQPQTALGPGGCAASGSRSGGCQGDPLENRAQILPAPSTTWPAGDVGPQAWVPLRRTGPGPREAAGPVAHVRLGVVAAAER